MIHLITGGAGCIGSELAGALLARGETVRVLDNLSSGRIEHLQRYMADARFEFLRGDVHNPVHCNAMLRRCDMVWHLTAKTDIKNLRPSEYDFEADYEQNLETTWVLLKSMRAAGVKRLAFASSAAVYGDQECLHEDAMLAPISMYGATKLACEAIIRALALRTGMQAWIFRYCSIVSGKARTSGNMVIPDLVHKLLKDPTRLEIYGDGNQTKPSLHVSECVEAMLYAVDNYDGGKFAQVWNVGAPDAISVTRQAELICEAMGLQCAACQGTGKGDFGQEDAAGAWVEGGCIKCEGTGGRPRFEYTGGVGGWPGDVPSFRMCTDKLANLGWQAKRTSEEAVRLAIQGLLESGE